MLHLAGLLLIPFVIAGVAFFIFRVRITWKEFAMQIAIQTSVMVGGFYLAKWGSMTSIEHWNGRITKKYNGEVSCS